MQYFRTSYGTDQRKGSLTTLTCCWLFLVFAGLCALWKYSYAQGRDVARTSLWPPDSKLSCEEQSPVIVVFIHPMCPCSRATLDQLKQIQTESHSDIQILIVLLQPRNGTFWTDSDNEGLARQLNDASVHYDRGGVEAQLFGAKSSGMCFFFDHHRHLQFFGGLTQSRGHSGESLGSRMLAERIRQCANQGVAEGPQSHPVYGCSLF